MIGVSVYNHQDIVEILSFNKPLLSIFKANTLFDTYFSLPNLNIDFFTFFLSIYIHKFLSNLLLVDGGPSKETISLELFSFIFNKLYLSSIPTVP